MAHVRWLKKSQDDLERLYDFIAEYSSDAADKALRTLIDAGNSLSEFPEKGRPWPAEIGFRELIVQFGSRGYVIRYHYQDDDITIIRIWHTLENR